MATKLVKSMAAAVVAFGLAGGVAQAATLVIVGGEVGTIPGGKAKNDAIKPLGLAKNQAGYYGSQIRLVGNANITFTLLGAEAGYENKFIFTGAKTGNTLTDKAGGNAFDKDGFSSISFENVVQGLLPFSFWTSGGKLTVANGQNPNNTAPGVKSPGINFFATFADNKNSKSGTTLLLFFDDDGANNDDNHDDLVIRATVSAVPLPASALLLGLGLAGLGAARLRRKG